MHPDIEALARHAFGELAGAAARELTRHLRGCQECHAAYQRVTGSLEAAPAKVERHEVDALMSKLRTWDASPLRIRLKGDALKRRVAGALAPYLGRAGANALLDPVQEDGGNLLSNVAPALTMFLGRRAAGNLVSRMIQDSTITNVPL
ncbi:MAG: hypothetical protein ABI759_15755 [Candidatus Solibacter sp.]